MTAANAPSGAASASTFYSVSGTEYPAWRAFTRGTNYGAYDRWLTANTNVTTGWLQYDLPGNLKLLNRIQLPLQVQLAALIDHQRLGRLKGLMTLLAGLHFIR